MVKKRSLEQVSYSSYPCLCFSISFRSNRRRKIALNSNPNSFSYLILFILQLFYNVDQDILLKNLERLSIGGIPSK